MTSPTHPFCLSQLKFSSSIDYVTFATPGKQDLPLTLTGRPEWGVAANYRQLTIHDLQPGDVPQLTRMFGSAPLLGMEVTIDARPVGKHLGLDERARALDLGIEFVAMHLYPYGAPFMAQAKTGAYAPELQKLQPFSHRLPRPHWQLLYGLRSDGPVQVKSYRKGVDNGARLAVANHSVRIEVRLTQQMCERLGLRTLEELIGFPYRRVFSPYFCMVRGVVAERPRTKRSVLKLVNARRAEVRQREAHASWARVGVQGVRDIPGLRYQRHVRLNQRIRWACTACRKGPVAKI
jgi:hypothetical protein